MHSEEQSTIVVQPIDKAKVRGILKVTGILAAITTVEIMMAFWMPAGHLRIGIFIIMTLVKAGYIVGEFMHLKHEVKFLIYAILMPLLFIIWLIFVLIYEGGYLFDSNHPVGSLIQTGLFT